MLIDMVEGNAAADLRRWTKKADAHWIAGIEVVATDLAESFRAGLSPKFDHAVRVADPFHVVRVRHEAPCNRGRVRDRPSVLSQQDGKAEGSLTLEAQGRVGSSPDNDGAGRHCQPARCPASEMERRNELNEWLNPLKCETGSNLADAGRAAVRADLYVRGRRLRSRPFTSARRPPGKTCGVPGGVTASSLGIPRLTALAEVSFEAYEAQACPLCDREVPIVENIGRGVFDGGSALEMLVVGARAAQVGTACFADPRAPYKVLEQLTHLLSDCDLPYESVVGSL